MGIFGIFTDAENQKINEELALLKQQKLFQDQQRLETYEAQFVSAGDAKLLAQLHPIPKVMIRKTLIQAGKRGWSVGLNMGLRSVAEQDALYQQGRELRDGIWVVVHPLEVVTKRPGGLSFHNYALAGDIVFKNKSGEWTWDYRTYPWHELGQIGKSLGLDWGGDFKTIDDEPHFEYKKGLNNAQEALAIYKQGGMDAVWAKII